MSTFSQRLNKGSLPHTVLALVAALIFIAVLTGLNEGWGIADSVAFWTLFSVGFVLCAVGPLGQGATYGWWNPLHIIGYVVGAVILLLGAGMLFDITVPGVSTVQTSIWILAGLMVVKGMVVACGKKAWRPGPIAWS